MAADNLSDPTDRCRHFGRFEDAGHYLKDFFFLESEGRFHLYYNVGVAGPEQTWSVPGNEDSFGYATSQDLIDWEIHQPVMHAERGTWEGMCISAPCILRHGGEWKMLYTGFSDYAEGCQAIGLATSRDLETWTRYHDNPVCVGPSWSAWTPDGWADCRDPHVIRVGDRFVMYGSVRTNDNRGAIAIWESEDLIDWTDRGAAFYETAVNERGIGRVPESPVVFSRDGRHFLITSQNDGYWTDHPDEPDWQRFEFVWPDSGFYAGMEVVQTAALGGGSRQIAAMFEWKPKGNFIRFWDISWRNGFPYVAY